MNWNQFFKHLTGICAILFCQTTAYSQSTLIFDHSSVSITGESSLHDWKVEAKEVIDHPIEFSFDSKDSTRQPFFSFKVSVTSMDGGRGASMNSKIFKALKSDIHPYVIFKQTKPYYFQNKEDDTGHEFRITGNLLIAGITKEIEVFVSYVKEDDFLLFKGKYPFKLSDFNIDPPSAMFGQIQTKDDIEVHFEFNYKKVQ